MTVANKTAILAVKIVADTADARAGLDATGRSVDNLDRKLQAAAAAGAVALLYVLERLVERSATAASNLEQSAGAVESVFKAHAEGVEQLAKDAATNVGLAQSEYQQLAAVLGAQLGNMGVAEDQLVGKTAQLIDLGADLAATFGGTTADAVGALSSLLRGERDPIERYGVSIKQVDIDARRAAEGTAELTGEADRAAETQAVLSLLLEQTASASGQFAREADTAAGAQQRANAEWENAQAQLGEALIPLWVIAAQVLGEVAKWVAENSDLALALVIVLGILATTVIALTAAQWLLNIALTANPIGLIIVGIGLLIAIIVVLIENWEQVEQVAGEVWENLTGWVIDFIDWLKEADAWVRALFGGPAALFGVGGFGGGFEVGHHWDGDDPDPSAGTGPWPVWASGEGRSSTRAPDVTNITVTGAIDPYGTARTIKKVLTASGKITGGLPAGGVVTQP